MKQSAAVVKAITLFLCIHAVLATDDHATDDRAILIHRISQLFEVTASEVEKCVDTARTDRSDMKVLQTWFNDEVVGPVDMKALNRASCALTCVAQIQGTMIKSQLNMKRIHRLISESSAPVELANRLHEYVDICEEKVRTKTDECEVGREFIRCLVKQDLLP